MIVPMKLISFVCVLALSIPSAALAGDLQGKPPAAAAKTAKGGRVIRITGSDTMKFDVTRIEAKPGERLRVVLRAVGQMPKLAMAHNFVLLKAGVDPNEFNKAAMTARDTDFIPPALKNQVHAFTPLAGAGETVEVTFAAPAKPGTYTYLCSFPAHFLMGMKGELVVK
jgi:azurin